MFSSSQQHLEILEEFQSCLERIEKIWFFSIENLGFFYGKSDFHGNLIEFMGISADCYRIWGPRCEQCWLNHVRSAFSTITNSLTTSLGKLLGSSLQNPKACSILSRLLQTGIPLMDDYPQYIGPYNPQTNHQPTGVLNATRLVNA